MRSCATRTAAAVATIATGLAVIAGGATAAGAATVEPVVDITVEIDRPSVMDGQGPMVFSATDVTIGDGPELTGADEVANPSDWVGDIEVDIDLANQQFTVSGGEDYFDFETADMTLTITGDFVLGGVELIEDTLFDAETDLEYALYDGTFYAAWTVLPQDGVVESALMSGGAVFSFAEAGDHPFVDVQGDMAYSTYNEHWYAIGFLGAFGIAEGWEGPDGQEYRPYERTTRDALAAFFYRTFAGELANPDAESPFVDVSSDPDSPHYSQHWEAIYWMAEQGLATGWAVDGGFEYRPTAQITRDAVAAFLFRYDGQATAPESDPFVDVSRDEDSGDYSEHAGAIAWMYEQGLSNGWNTADGPEYRPTAKITRDAIAAFIYRTATQQLPS